MSKYSIAYCGNRFFVRMEVTDNPKSNYRYFAGYDFMGSAEWADLFSFDYALEKEEAKQIVKDLESADI